MTKADAEDGELAYRAEQGFDCVIENRRVSGAVADEQAVGLVLEDFVGAWFRAGGR